MKCINHPDIETDILCTECQKPVCENCRITLADSEYCRACLEEKVRVSPVVEAPVSFVGVKSRFWAFVLSFLPGAGYMYLGLMNRGLQAMTIFFGTIFIAKTLNFPSMVMLVTPVLLFYSIFDTQQLVRRSLEGHPIADVPLVDLGQWSNSHNLVGYGLILFGSLALLENLLPFYFNYEILHRILPPFLIIGLGLYILYRTTYRKSDEKV